MLPLSCALLALYCIRASAALSSVLNQRPEVLRNPAEPEPMREDGHPVVATKYYVRKRWVIEHFFKRFGSKLKCLHRPPGKVMATGRAVSTRFWQSSFD